ncbi:MAG: type II toxin-antitoxin system VapC family toxin [Rhodospirillaceae bacterium]|nr:type II toxin-antitoxin system VapC family toxin [Rhodospirillaceae bacterium]
MILDTNALSAFIDGETALRHWVRGPVRPAIPVIVIGEFRYGIAASRHRLTYERWLDAHLSKFMILDVTSTTAKSYAQLRSSLKQAGRPLPANDIWIAALAVEHALPILSRDAHFDAVPGVRRVGW